jgi:hypothetical protein
MGTGVPSRESNSGLQADALRTELRRKTELGK